MAQASRWLVLAAALGCATVAPPDRGPTEVATQYLYYRLGDHDDPDRPDPAASGGVGDLYVEVGENASGRAPVRFAETVSGGVGEAWRATVWMALLAAANTLEADPATLRVTVEAGGTVDGPSAGALMAAAITAGARGAPALPGVTMTGTVNPDMTIGPVGGVPEKVAAALDAGKTLIGIPVGQRQAVSRRTGQRVDVLALARRRGAQVRVIRDVAEAFSLLTGVELPPEDALEPEEMALPEAARDVFTRRARVALAEVEESQRTLVSGLIAKLDMPRLRDRAKDVDVYLLLARAWLGQGWGVAGMWATARAHRAHHLLKTEVLTHLGARFGQWSSLRDLLLNQRAALHLALTATVPRWKGFAPWRASEVPFVVEAFESFIHTLRGLAQASALVDENAALKQVLDHGTYASGSPEELVGLIEAMQRFNTFMVEAHTRMITGSAYLDLGEGLMGSGAVRPDAPIDEQVLLDVAQQYERVADANLEYVDALLLRPLADQVGRGLQEVRFKLIEEDEDYRQAFLHRHLPGVLSERVLESRQRSYANLSGAVSSYFASATLISKRYSLNARYDRDDELLGVEHSDAFESMIVLADRQTRIVAARCLHDLGEVPLSTLIDYALARRLEAEGRRLAVSSPAVGFRMRMNGLTHLWRAWTLGRVALTTYRRMLNAAQRPDDRTRR